MASDESGWPAHDRTLHHHGTLTAEGVSWFGNVFSNPSLWSEPPPPDAPHRMASADATAASDPPPAADATSQPTTAAIAPLATSSFAAAAIGPAPEFGSAGLTINISYDSSIGSAPAGYTAAIDAAVQYLESLITDPITVNIQFGYGSYDNGTRSVPAGSVGANVVNPGFTTYSNLRTAVLADATSTDDAAAVASLPGASPNGSSFYFLARAQQKALGLVSATSTVIDGYVGLSSAVAFTYDPNNRAVVGQYDAIGVLEHEITEVMGRVASLGTYEGPYYTLLDLFRYSAAGVRDLTPGPGAFSVDGVTLLNAFNDPTAVTADAGDWDTTSQGDSFGFASTNTLLQVSANDLRVMDVLGYGVACFAAGTCIATPDGDRPVERLRAGDRVVARFSGEAAVKWIGQRRIDCRRHPDPTSVTPIRIRRNAFGPGRPHRDLLLSPDHAVATTGALVPIRLLANGGSIVAEPAIRWVKYFHIELDRHDLVSAEGLETETYLDTGNRCGFSNSDGPVRLHPDFAGAQGRREAGSCLRLLTDAELVRLIWQTLATRAQQLGFVLPSVATSADPGLVLMVGGHTIQPAAIAATCYRFVVPHLAQGARLVSRSMVPAALHPWQEDRRRLGVMVRGITLHLADQPVELAIDDPVLEAGWWSVESDGNSLWRWTDGDAALPVAPGCRMVEIRLGDTLAYPLTDARAPAIANAPANRAAHAA